MNILKKTILLLIIFASIATTARAEKTESELREMYCPKAAYDLSNPVSRGFQTLTGVNMLASKVAASQIKQSISEYVQGDIKVKVNSYSATDAKNGRFKSFEVKGSDLNFYSIYLSELTAKTACDFIYLDLEKNPVELKEPMVIDFTAKFTEKDMNSIVKTTTYRKYLLNIKYNSKNLKFVELNKPQISLKDDKFHFSIQVNAPFVKPFVFNVMSDLQIKDNKVKINEMYVGSNSKQVNLQLSKFFTNVFNPLWFAQLVLNQHNCHLLLKSVKIQDEKIIISGTVFMAKS